MFLALVPDEVEDVTTFDGRDDAVWIEVPEVSNLFMVEIFMTVTEMIFNSNSRLMSDNGSIKTGLATSLMR